MTSKELKMESMFTSAYCGYGKMLTAYAFSKTHDHAVSDDLVQETFLKAWLYLLKGGEIHMMKSFLYHIMRNLIVDEYRKHKMTSLDVLQEKGFECGVDYTEHLFNVIDGNKMVSLLNYLPARYREVMKMRFVQGLSLTEMSRITGQPKNTIAVQAYRGVKNLKLIYRDHSNERRFAEIKNGQELTVEVLISA